jgi:hypothetical protein
MSENKAAPEAINSADRELVLTQLEHDQLASVKKHRFPRRKLKPLEAVALWSLRIYVVLMVGVVIYQILAGAK